MTTNHLLALGFTGALAACGLYTAAPLAASTNNAGDTSTSPIQKIGTIDIDTVETAPIVFNDKLYRFESIRPGYHGNDTGQSYFQLVDVETGEPTPAFAQGHALGSVYTEDGKMYAFGVPGWGASKINVFVSTDLENWEQHEILDLPGWEIYNTSVCKSDDRYVLVFEVGNPPEVVGNGFTGRFAESDDLLDWTLLPEPAVYTKEKYSACPTIRWTGGWFYMTHLNAIGNYQFETNMVRSRDLETWEQSPRNPVLTFDEQDKTIASDRLSWGQIAEVREALNRNNSDIDYTEFDGQVVIYYSWGDQVGNEFLAKAFYDGTLDAFFAYYFPEGDAAQ